MRSPLLQFVAAPAVVRRFFRLMLLALCAALPAAGQVAVAAPSLPVRSLKGIATVAVFFDPIAPDFLKAGADIGVMRRTVEQALRQKGIAVDELARSVLHLTLRTALSQDGVTYAFAYRMELRQPVQIVSQGNLPAQLSTWGFESAGWMWKTTVVDQTAKTTTKLIETFLKDWEVVNPASPPMGGPAESPLTL